MSILSNNAGTKSAWFRPFSLHITFVKIDTRNIHDQLVTLKVIYAFRPHDREHGCV